MIHWANLPAVPDSKPNLNSEVPGCRRRPGPAQGGWPGRDTAGRGKSTGIRVTSGSLGSCVRAEVRRSFITTTYAIQAESKPF